MSAPKHTPGPWRLKGSGSIYGADGDLVATCGYQVSVGSTVDERNASLIAAAPEMAEALLPFARLAEEVSPSAIDATQFYGLNNATPITVGDLRRALAVLRKSGRIP